MYVRIISIKSHKSRSRKSWGERSSLSQNRLLSPLFIYPCVLTSMWYGVLLLLPHSSILGIKQGFSMHPTHVRLKTGKKVIVERHDGNILVVKATNGKFIYSYDLSSMDKFRRRYKSLRGKTQTV